MEAHAKALGATAFGNSKAKGKRYYVIYNNKIINFGSDIGSTFIDHHDQKKRRAWQESSRTPCDFICICR